MINFYLTKMIQSFGIDEQLVNLYSIPLYLLATISTYFLCRSSDNLGERCYHMMTSIAVCFVGFLGLFLFAPGTGIFKHVLDDFPIVSKLFSFFVVLLVIMGNLPTIPLCFTWISSSLPVTKPVVVAIGASFMTSCGQIAALLAPQLFILLENQLYIYLSMLVFLLLAASLCLFLRFYTLKL